MSPFCQKFTIDNILRLREQLSQRERYLAQVGEKALYAYYETTGKGTVPENRRINVHLGSDGTSLVYDLGGAQLNSYLLSSCCRQMSSSLNIESDKLNLIEKCAMKARTKLSVIMYSLITLNVLTIIYMIRHEQVVQFFFRIVKKINEAFWF